MSEVTKIAEQLNKKVAQLNNERSRQLGMQEAAKKQYDSAIKAYEAKYGVQLTPENLQEEYNKAYKDLKTNIEVLKRTIESIENGEYKKVTSPNIDLEPEVEIGDIEEETAVVQETPVEEKVEEKVEATIPSKPKVEITPVEGKKEPIFGGIAIPEVEDTEDEEEDEDEPEVAFGGLDFSGFTPPNFEENVEQNVEQKVEEKAEEKVEEVEEGFDFSKLVGSTPTFETPKQTTKKEVKELNIPTDFVQPAPPKVEGVEIEDDDFGDDEEEESFSPDGWGKPKTNEDINKNFADILGSQGIKFGE